MELTRQPNEDVESYQIRLCGNKELLGLTWPDIAKLMNAELDEEYTESRYRKWWANFKQGYDYAIEQGITQDVVIKEFEDKRIEFEKERIRLLDQRREYRNLIRQQARSEHIDNQIANAIDRLVETKPIEWYESDKNFYTYRESLVVCNDWHYGLFTSNFWNEYNTDEFNRRIKRFVSKSVTYSQMNGVRTVHLADNGDLIHGLIHVTARIMATEDVISQTITVAEVLAEILAEYANQFDQVKYYHVSGNHARSVAQKKDSLQDENYERIVPWFLKTRLAHVHNIEFVDNVYDSSIASANILGLDIDLVHGDYDSPKSVAQNLSMMTGRKPDFIYMAHLHKFLRDEVHGTRIILAPALCGTEDYAKSIRKTSYAAQILTIFDEHETELCTYPVRLDIK